VNSPTANHITARAGLIVQRKVNGEPSEERAWATKINNRAVELQRSNPHLSLASAWCMAEKSISNDDPAQFAAETLLQYAGQEQGSLAQNLMRISNRHPHLSRMANRQAGWDALAELEPTAHQAYAEAVQLSPGDAEPIWRWRSFLEMISDMAIQYPDLGFEGRYQQLKQANPQIFWKWVLSCDPNAQPVPGLPLVYSHSNPSQKAIDAIAQFKKRNPIPRSSS
jgi:hypothetical protein